jgi:signal transduction histidine kinase
VDGALHAAYRRSVASKVGRKSTGRRRITRPPAALTPPTRPRAPALPSETTRSRAPSRPPEESRQSSRPARREPLERENQELEAKCAELDARLARAERTVKALRDVGLALGSTLDLDQLLELILGKIAELLDADRATLYLLDEQRGRLLSRIIIGAEARSIELPLGSGIAGQVAKYGHTIRIKDAYRDRRFSRSWDDVTGYRTRSILAAPMKNHVGRTIGVIQVLNKRGTAHGNVDEFSLYDEELLTALATQAAVSIDNSRLFLSVIQKNIQLVETKEQLEHRVSDLKLLFELESSMARASTFEDLARAVITEAARACGAQAGSVMVDEGEEGLWLYFIDLGRTEAKLLAQAGAMSEVLPEVRRVSVRRGEGIVGQAMRTNEAQHMVPPEPSRPSAMPPIALDSDGESGPVSGRLGTILGLSVTSAIAMPLEGPDEMPIGALALYNAVQKGGFSQDARALLRLVSANASTAVRLFLSRADRERSERLTSIGRLLSGVMHDLRTPMTVISGYVQLMAGTEEAGARAQHAKLIAKQFDAIGAMQREILQFARGERTTFVRRVYLSNFFADVRADIERELEGTDVRLVLDVDEKAVARFDAGKMMRVIHNLARNAIEAMSDKGGTLAIGARLEGSGGLVVTVSDTGRGIPDTVRKRLFQTFATSGKKGGTGLGLSIAKKIVEEHGGDIAAEAAKGGAGAKFVIRLPQRRESPEADAAESNSGNHFPTPRALPTKRPVVPAPPAKARSVRPRERGHSP